MTISKTDASPHYVRRFFLKHRNAILLGLLCLVVVDVLQLMIPRIVKFAVDMLASNAATSDRLFAAAGGIVLLSVLIGCFRYGWRRLLIGMSRDVEAGLRHDVVEHFMRLSPTDLSELSTGDLMARATHDITQVRMAAGMGIVALTDAVFLGLSAAGFMAYINWKLTLIALLPMPFIVIATRWLGKEMHRRYGAVQVAFADMTEVVRESMAGIRAVKAFNRHQRQYERLESISDVYLKSHMHRVRVTGAMMPMMILLTQTALALVLWQGGQLALYGTISPGEFVAFISYLGMLTWPMMALGWVTNLIQRGKASLERIEVVLNHKPQITAPDLPVRFPEISGAMSFSNVRFIYPGGNVPVIDGFDLSVDAGSFIGITGPPGAGKSTLLQLLLRFYDVSDGAIQVDGVDVRKRDLTDLRSSLAWVPQEPFLFSTTIRDNICFGRRHITSGDLDSAVADSGLLPDLSSIPGGLDARIGEKGVLLSGGQKQRITLARALLSEAAVWLLDDPVSQVDSHTAELIMAALAKKAKGKTIIMVSHRISSISGADHVVVMEGGTITESGPPADLLKANGFYSDAYWRQQLQEKTYAV